MRKTEVMTKLKRNQNGITLIALVITIIVLLILAGVAISMLSGENGILKQAANAKTETEKTSTMEQLRVGVISALTQGTGKVKSLEDLKTGLENSGVDLDENITGDKNDGFTVKTNGQKYLVLNNGEIIPIITDISKLTTAVEEKTIYEHTSEDKTKTYRLVIPENFKIAKESPTIVTKGMIIEDSEGNQYVWIPVFTKEQYSWGVDYSTVTSENDYMAIQTALKNYTGTYANSYYSDVWFGDSNTSNCGYYAKEDTAQENLIYYTNGNMTETEYNTLYHNMLKSIYKNGGFYIGRYEMGIAVVNSTTEAQNISRTSASKEYVASSTNTSNEAPTIEGMSIPVSKANAVGYNWMTQSQAQMLAKKIGEKSGYTNVISSIMFGVQWDAVCVFIENFDINNTSTTKSDWLKSESYSPLWGNCYYSVFKLNQGYYTTTYGNAIVTWNQDYTTAKERLTAWLCTTGASNQNSSLNIYDFEGNLAEWTLERFSKYTSYPGVYRGDNFGSTSYAASRDYSATYTKHRASGSRVSLYVK